MAIEIERKFLVDNEKWNAVIKPEGELIHQGYLHSDNSQSIRVRYTNDKGYLTIKGAQVGISRPEFEYEIPLSDAIELFNNFCATKVIKRRYVFQGPEFIWEVDEFMDKNMGLITAEIELKDESDQIYNKPEWIGKDITQDEKYKNSNLAK